MPFVENSARNGDGRGAAWWCTWWIWFAGSSLCCSSFEPGYLYLSSWSPSQTLFAITDKKSFSMQIILDSFLVNFWLRKEVSNNAKVAWWNCSLWSLNRFGTILWSPTDNSCSESQKYVCCKTRVSCFFSLFLPISSSSRKLE